MTFQKGNKLGKGRPKLSKDKVTQEMRETFMFLLKDNKDKLQVWLDTIAKDSPGLAFKLMLDVSKRFIPEIKENRHTDASGDKLSLMPTDDQVERILSQWIQRTKLKQSMRQEEKTS